MRILVVEDEPELLRLIGQALREEGYAVDEAADGFEGSLKAKNWDYDAVVLDLMLPRMSGWELLTQLRQRRKTPVLILSARDGINDRIKGLDLGADDYLIKPFDLGELLARLRSLIRRAAGQAESVIVVGDVAIDLRSKKVHLGGEPVALTAREFAIVEMLALQKGRVVTRTEIYDHIFDENDDSISNLLDVHVGHIRRKLGKDFIQTRRGQGYMIE